jgi:hypothetical protein
MLGLVRRFLIGDYRRCFLSCSTMFVDWNGFFNMFDIDICKMISDWLILISILTLSNYVIRYMFTRVDSVFVLSNGALRFMV